MPAPVDIFGRTAPREVTRYSADKVRLNFTSFDQPFFVQQVQMSYAQRVSRIYDLGNPDRMLWIIGRPEGSLSMTHILTETENMFKVIAALGDACEDTATRAATMTFPSGNCEGNATMGGGFVFNSPVLVNLGLSMSVSDYVMSDNMQLMFSYLSKL